MVHLYSCDCAVAEVAVMISAGRTRATRAIGLHVTTVSKENWPGNVWLIPPEQEQYEYPSDEILFGCTTCHLKCFYVLAAAMLLQTQ